MVFIVIIPNLLSTVYDVRKYTFFFYFDVPLELFITRYVCVCVCVSRYSNNVNFEENCVLYFRLFTSTFSDVLEFASESIFSGFNSFKPEIQTDMK
jgi:hypothetical protein